MRTPQGIALGGEGRTLARASQPGGGHAEVVELARPGLRGTTLGRDANEGVARAARLPTRRARSLAIELGRGCCDGVRPAEVHGELWGEAINGSGLEAVTPHIRFRYG